MFQRPMSLVVYDLKVSYIFENNNEIAGFSKRLLKLSHMLRPILSTLSLEIS